MLLPINLLSFPLPVARDFIMDVLQLCWVTIKLNYFVLKQSQRSRQNQWAVSALFAGVFCQVTVRGDLKDSFFEAFKRGGRPFFVCSRPHGPLILLAQRKKNVGFLAINSTKVAIELVPVLSKTKHHQAT
ncbi:hypothetical protein [Lactiplantibacillus paraxiangfangensis]|uniref:hypothetical protein n=1 Tax=Lactiplantibacillus paraxiangfangensis TaxID=3076224 RepID=UPI0030C65AC4